MFALPKFLRGSYSIGKLALFSLAILTGALLACDLLLIQQNRNLKQSERRSEAARPRIGAALPPLTGLALNGAPVRVDWGADDRDTFLFIFSPVCGFCSRNWPTWQQLASIAKLKSHRLVYLNVSTRLERTYAAQVGIANATVIQQPEGIRLSAFGLVSTPEVVRISRRGRIEQAWIGILEERDLSNLKQALSNDMASD